MGTRTRVLSLLSRLGTASGAEIAQKIGVSRQAVNKHLQALASTGLVVKSGGTRNASYTPVGRGAAVPRRAGFSGTLSLKGLQEDRVFLDVERRMGLPRALNRNAQSIFRYVFTEILNNAIEHARSKTARVQTRLSVRELECSIRDFGVGAFETIRKKFGLADEADAMLELVKGKRTTMPERHSGEGIFFSSRVCQRLIIRSHALTLTFDSIRRDTFSSGSRFITGTAVSFGVSRNSKRTLKSVFDRFAKEEYDFTFSKTEVKVKLLNTEYISRSEAKRLLSGLDKFREIVLDFSGVGSIGQGFAHEVFRVFGAGHPGVKIDYVNASPAVGAMIRHVVDKVGSNIG